MVSDPPKLTRPYMVSFLMVSRHLDRLNMPTAYMLTKISKFPANWCARAAVGRRKTALGAPHSPEIGHTMYAVILHHLCHIIILFITCTRTHQSAHIGHSIYALTNRAHPPKKCRPRRRRRHMPPQGASSPCLHPTLPTFFTNLNSSFERKSIIIH